MRNTELFISISIRNTFTTYYKVFLDNTHSFVQLWPENDCSIVRHVLVAAIESLSMLCIVLLVGRVFKITQAVGILVLDCIVNTARIVSI